MSRSRGRSDGRPIVCFVCHNQSRVLHHTLISACGNRLASVRPKVSSSRRTSWTTVVRGGDLIASPRGQHAGACSELHPSCTTSRLQLFWTGTRLDSESVWTDSQMHGICACSPTHGVGRSCGRPSAVTKRNSTKPIQKYQHLLRIGLGTVSSGPGRTTWISGKKNWKTKLRTSGMCDKW